MQPWKLAGRGMGDTKVDLGPRRGRAQPGGAWGATGRARSESYTCESRGTICSRPGGDMEPAEEPMGKGASPLTISQAEAAMRPLLWPIKRTEKCHGQ